MQITLIMSVVDGDDIDPETVVDAIIDDLDNSTVDVEHEDDDGHGDVTTVTIQGIEHVDTLLP